MYAIPTFGSSGLKATRFGIEGIAELCALTGNPQQGLKVIHVAGTNGKGSVCNQLGWIYTNAGYTTGVYTSPHLTRINERFMVQMQPAPDEALLEFFQLYGDVVLEFKPTFFELTTVIAFWYFKTQNTDICIIETGLGGRLDATNIVSPMACVITSIGYDHTDILGDTLQQIAFEKAGIIKKNVPLVCGNIPVVALEVIQHKARQQDADIHFAMDLKPEFVDGAIYLLQENGEKRCVKSDFLQPVQAINVAISFKITAILQNQFPVNDALFHAGIGLSSKQGAYKARFEQLHPAYEVWFDGAHNPEAFEIMLKLTLKKAGIKKKVLVFSIMRDKLTQEMLSLISQFEELYYFESTTKRAASVQEVRALLPDAKQFNDKEWVLLLSRLHAKTVFVVFSGSLYFYSHVLGLFNNTHTTFTPAKQS